MAVFPDRPRPLNLFRMGLFALALVAAASAWRCGREKGDDDDDVVDPPGVDVPDAPKDWDGKTDWADSYFQVVDE